MIFHGIMKITLFFAVGAIMHQTGSTYIYEISGYGKKMPVVFACLSIAGIALIGIPPLTGFISKWNIATAAAGAWQQGNRLAPVLICVLILSAFLTSIYIFTIIIKAYLPAKFTPVPGGQAPAGSRTGCPCIPPAPTAVPGAPPGAERYSRKTHTRQAPGCPPLPQGQAAPDGRSPGIREGAPRYGHAGRSPADCRSPGTRSFRFP